MKTQFVVAALIFGTFFLARAFEYSAPPERSYFDAGVWRNRDVLVIPREGIVLTEPTTIAVDEVILDGPLTTNGYALRIDALKITFNENGLIRGFNEPAPAGRRHPAGTNGTMSTAAERPAGEGQKPPRADDGAPGHPSPAPIVIAAGQIEGEPRFDLDGQAGGRGGDGGPGGDGGKGGPGRPAKAGCWIGPHPGGDGGRGGRGGPGGDGGQGGVGGPPVPMTLALGRPLATDVDLRPRAGAPGAPGTGGAPGRPGEGGDAGERAVAACLVYRKTASAGQRGPRGESQNAWGEPGSPRQATASPDRPGITLLDFENLDRLRDQLIPAWASFHWSRSLLFLILDTLTEATAGTPHTTLSDVSNDEMDDLIAAVNRERLEALRSIWADFFAGIDHADELGPAVEATRLLLDALIETKPNHESIATRLDQLRLQIETKLQSRLTNALEACNRFNEEKIKRRNDLAGLTARYATPACEGRPDLRRPENVDKPISLYPRRPAYYPPVLANLHRRLARVTYPSPFPVAYAEGFEIVATSAQSFSSSEFDSRIPRLGLWIKPGLGVFGGLPAPRRAKSSGEIAEGLANLRRSLAMVRR